MDTKWLEDFLSLAEEGSFTKAAEKRYVTQPAFSRRIRALEDWLGAELIDRNTHPTRLTLIGQESIAPLKQLLNNIDEFKTNIQARQVRSHTSVLSTQASLSVSFCPGWYSSVQNLLGEDNIRVVAGDLYDCVDQFLAGHSDMLLCYALAEINPSLNRGDLRRMQLGIDQLIPVYKYGAEASISTKGTDDITHYKTVNFPSESFFGQLIQTHCIYDSEPGAATFDSAFETALSESVYAHVLAGVGMAWLPKSLVQNDLVEKRLMRLTNLPSVEMKIMFLTQAANSCSSAINDIWRFMQKEHPQSDISSN